MQGSAVSIHILSLLPLRGSLSCAFGTPLLQGASQRSYHSGDFPSCQSPLRFRSSGFGDFFLLRSRTADEVESKEAEDNGDALRETEGSAVEEPAAQIVSYEEWRQSLEKLGKADPVKKAMSNGMKYLFDRPAFYTTALKFSPLANLIPECCTHFSNWNAWGIGHAMPEFAKKSFHQLWKEGKVK